MKSLKGKKVLVTGGGGFIGSHLVEYLARHDAALTVLLRYTSTGKIGWLEYFPDGIKAKINFVFGDVRDPDVCHRAVDGNDYIFHLAAQIAIPYSYIAPRDFLAVNAMGTANMLASARDGGVKKFLQVSTSEVYGTAQYVPIDEKHPQTAQSPYAASKIASDRMAESFHLTYDLPVVIVRPFNTYGPRQSARAVIPTIILQALRGTTIRLGNKDTRRDMNYVEDIVEGMASACFDTKTIGRTINLATGRDHGIDEITAKVGDILGRRLMIKTDRRRVRPKKSEVWRLQGDASLARKLFGYRPGHNLKMGLEKTVAFFQKNIGMYKKEDYQL
ncbi:Nucleoside-diphosphate-sugar epimerase [Candidatus Zixiibacteriota bacterium]|nr:Nucleoside-diphosphate-sugar epimerase [candidate division Zixibacteria bacterium]